MGIGEILTIIFVTMKLLGKIEWSWWLVLLPEIIALALYVLIVVSIIVSCNRTNKRKNKYFKDMFQGGLIMNLKNF